MKKISFLLICCLPFLVSGATISHGEESTENTIEITKNVAKSEKLEVDTEKNPVYATVQQGESIQPDDFKETIEEVHQLKIKKINFSGNQRANTMSMGNFKTELAFSTTDGKNYVGKFPYLVENEQATIFFDDVSYDTTKTRFSFKVSEQDSNVYLKANETIFNCHPDNNGFFEGKYNPKVSPKTMQLIALDSVGNYSDEHILLLEKNNSHAIITSLNYQANENKLTGTVPKNTDIIIHFSEFENKTVKPDNKGIFTFSYKATPEIIQLTLKDKKGSTDYEFKPFKRNAKTLNELNKADNHLAPLRDKRPKKTAMSLTFIISLGAILLIIRHFLSARRQN